MKKYKVIKNHRSEFDKILLLQKGQLVTGIEKETSWKGWLWCDNTAWVPNSVLAKTEKTGVYQVLDDYSSFELDVDIGEQVKGNKIVNSWIWVTNTEKKEGWVPLENLEYLQD